MHGNHLKHMLIGGAVALGALLLVGLPFGTALPYALFFACAVMMVAMMFMGGGHGHGGHHHGAEDAGTGADNAPAGRRDT